jgi:hypothetical protein
MPDIVVAPPTSGIHLGSRFEEVASGDVPSRRLDPSMPVEVPVGTTRCLRRIANDGGLKGSVHRP